MFYENKDVWVSIETPRAGIKHHGAIVRFKIKTLKWPLGTSSLCPKLPLELRNAAIMQVLTAGIDMTDHVVDERAWFYPPSTRDPYVYYDCSATFTINCF